MNIKNMLCAIFMMSAALGHSVAIAVGVPRLSVGPFKKRLVIAGVLGAGVGGTLGYQQGETDSLGKQSLKTLAGGAVGTAVAVVGFAGMVLLAAVIKKKPR